MGNEFDPFDELREPAEVDLTEGLGTGREASPSDLTQTIQQHIIPRLVMAHTAGAPAVCVDTRGPPTQAEISALARLATQQRLEDAVTMVVQLSREGLSIESLLLGLLAPTARALGEAWLNDELSFADVTVGLGTLHRVLMALRPPPRSLPTDAPLVVLALAPGEQHSLGLAVFSELLKPVGLSVVVTQDYAEALDLVRQREAVALGFSVSSDRWLKPLRKVVGAAKRHSRNDDLLILIGGSYDATSFASKAGVTYCADVREAVRLVTERRSST
jgi:methanogenic corrinoid protein MtbC1